MAFSIVKNMSGKEFRVTFNKWFKYEKENIKFKLMRENDMPSEFKEFFGLDIRLNVANVGCVVIVENKRKGEHELPCYIPDVETTEFDIIYDLIDKGFCMTL
jgi:hypothetical protein